MKAIQNSNFKNYFPLTRPIILDHKHRLNDKC